MGRIPPVTADLGDDRGGSPTITAYDVISGHGSPFYVFASGFVAGALLWVPVYAILLFNRFMVASSGARVGVYGGGLGVEPAALLPYMAATGVLGIVFAALRRLSARINWYKEIASQRLGLNGVVATILGALICIGLIVSGSRAGLLVMFLSVGVLFGGFIVNALWEMAHNLLLRPYGASRGDELIEKALRHELARNSAIRPARVENVSVTNGRVALAAAWESAEVREEAIQTLQRMPGVVSIDLERLEE